MGWERWELSRLIKVIFIRGLNNKKMGWERWELSRLIKVIFIRVWILKYKRMGWERWELSRLIKVIFIRGLNTRGWDENDGNYLD